MVDSAARPADGAVSFSSRLAARRTIALVLVPFLLVAAVGLARGGLAPTRPNLVALTGGATNLAPPQLTRAAAEVLERALAKGGGGITFEIVQTSTITARRGGPLVEIPDPADRTKSLGAAERYVVGTLIERGVATPDGYWMELLYGPEPGADPDHRHDLRRQGPGHRGATETRVPLSRQAHRRAGQGPIHEQDFAGLKEAAWFLSGK